MEAVGFLGVLVRALGRGWSARYGMIVPYGVFGLNLTSDVGGAVEIVPSLVRGPAVIWSPFVFTRGTPHYELHAEGKLLLRTPKVEDAVARLERWRQARGPAGRVAARLAKVGKPRRPQRTTEIDTRPEGQRGSFDPPRATPTAPMRAVEPPADGAGDETGLAAALRDGKLDRARKLARQGDAVLVRRTLRTLLEQGSGTARATAAGVLAAIAEAGDGAELARYLMDLDRKVQRAAVDGVKRAGYVAALPALAALVIDRDSKPASAKTQLAAAAAVAMKALSGRRGAAGLLGYLDAPDPRLREAACIAVTLAPAASGPLRRALEQLLDDSDPRVARAAKRALATLA